MKKLFNIKCIVLIFNLFFLIDLSHSTSQKKKNSNNPRASENIGSSNLGIGTNSINRAPDKPSLNDKPISFIMVTGDRIKITNLNPDGPFAGTSFTNDEGKLVPLEIGSELPIDKLPLPHSKH